MRLSRGAPGIIAVFAKPPRPGAVKTRLAASVGDEAAAALARAFLEDTWRSLQSLAGARLVLAGTASESADYGLSSAELWPQGDGDLGARMERIARRALEVAPWFIALGTDSPGLPTRILDAARAFLERCDAVLGPAADGGYYLLGLRRAEPGLLAGLPWSAPTTYAATAERLSQRGYTAAAVEPWFDVDEMDDLRRLGAALASGALAAPRTAAAMKALGLL